MFGYVWSSRRRARKAAECVQEGERRAKAALAKGSVKGGPISESIILNRAYCAAGGASAMRKAGIMTEYYKSIGLLRAYSQELLKRNSGRIFDIEAAYRAAGVESMAWARRTLDGARARLAVRA
ncbi:MAG: hypothetical protein QW548_00845 [Candidatus Aenigmatarchaeota archaeon]